MIPAALGHAAGHAQFVAREYHWALAGVIVFAAVLALGQFSRWRRKAKASRRRSPSYPYGQR